MFMLAVSFKDAKGAKMHKAKSTENPKRSTTRPTRRHSEPVPGIEVTDTGRHDVNDDDDTVKLQNLYNKAIETVKLADESLLTNQKPRNPRVIFFPLLFCASAVGKTAVLIVDN